MKRSFHTIEPNYNAVAKLSVDQQFVAELRCRVWLPRHIYERPFLAFESTDVKDRVIGILSPKYDVSIDMLNFAGEPDTRIHATEVFWEKFLTWPQGNNESLLITFQGEPYRLIESHVLRSKTVRSPTTTTILYLTDNFLLRPDTIVQRSYTGTVKVRKVRDHTDSVEPFKTVEFDSHHYYIKTPDGGTACYRRLVAVVKSSCPAEDITSLERQIKPRIEDYLLLTSLAANQRTNIVGWQSNDEKHLVRGWYGNVRVLSKHDEPKHSHDNCLIDLLDFKKFMNVAIKTFDGFGENEKELIRHAIYKVLPQEDHTIEARILSGFSSVEAIVLIHRKAKNLEFTIATNSWRKLEKALRQTVQNNSKLFATPTHMEMLKKMLPLLRRVALRDAFESYTEEHKIDLSDLWPMFNGVAALADIRNRIIHGDSFDERNWLPLCNAMHNLHCIAKRLILSTLGWDVKRSKVSKEFLRRNGWLPSSNLPSDMQTLART